MHKNWIFTQDGGATAIRLCKMRQVGTVKSFHHDTAFLIDTARPQTAVYYPSFQVVIDLTTMAKNVIWDWKSLWACSIKYMNGMSRIEWEWAFEIRWCLYEPRLQIEYFLMSCTFMQFSFIQAQWLDIIASLPLKISSLLYNTRPKMDQLWTSCSKIEHELA